MPDALQLLRNDHDKVKELFKQFEHSEDTRQKAVIAQEAIVNLLVHAEIEEEIFYPAVRAEGQDTHDMMNEAEAEHHVAEVLIEELLSMRPDDEMFDAKFKVLAENVRHHIQEEESEMLPKAAEEGAERMQELGREMEQRKMELMEHYQREVQFGGRRSSSRRSGTRGRSTSRTATGGRSGSVARGRTSARSRPESGSRSRNAASSQSSSSGSRSVSARGGSNAAGTRSRSTASRASSNRGATARARGASSRSRSASGRSARSTRPRSSRSLTRS